MNNSFLCFWSRRSWWCVWNREGGGNKGMREEIPSSTSSQLLLVYYQGAPTRAGGKMKRNDFGGTRWVKNNILHSADLLLWKNCIKSPSELTRLAARWQVKHLQRNRKAEWGANVAACTPRPNYSFILLFAASSHDLSIGSNVGIYSNLS